MVQFIVFGILVLVHTSCAWIRFREPLSRRNFLNQTLLEKLQNCAGKKEYECGLCGEGPDEMSTHLIPTEKYTVVDPKERILAVELGFRAGLHGYVEFRVCNVTDNSTLDAALCNKTTPLLIGPKEKWYPSAQQSFAKSRFRLPSGLVCERCVLQVKYTPGQNSTMKDFRFFDCALLSVAHHTLSANVAHRGTRPGNYATNRRVGSKATELKSENTVRAGKDLMKSINSSFAFVRTNSQSENRLNLNDSDSRNKIHEGLSNVIVRTSPSGIRTVSLVNLQSSGKITSDFGAANKVSIANAESDNKVSRMSLAKGGSGNEGFRIVLTNAGSTNNDARSANKVSGIELVETGSQKEVPRVTLANVRTTDIASRNTLNNSESADRVTRIAVADAGSANDVSRSASIVTGSGNTIHGIANGGTVDSTSRFASKAFSIKNVSQLNSSFEFVRTDSQSEQGPNLNYSESRARVNEGSSNVVIKTSPFGIRTVSLSLPKVGSANRTSRMPLSNAGAPNNAYRVALADAGSTNEVSQMSLADVRSANNVFRIAGSDSGLTDKASRVAVADVGSANDVFHNATTGADSGNRMYGIVPSGTGESATRIVSKTSAIKNGSLLNSSFAFVRTDSQSEHGLNLNDSESRIGMHEGSSNIVVKTSPAGVRTVSLVNLQSSGYIASDNGAENKVSLAIAELENTVSRMPLAKAGKANMVFRNALADAGSTNEVSRMSLAEAGPANDDAASANKVSAIAFAEAGSESRIGIQESSSNIVIKTSPSGIRTVSLVNLQSAGKITSGTEAENNVSKVNAESENKVSRMSLPKAGSANNVSRIALADIGSTKDMSRILRGGPGRTVVVKTRMVNIQTNDVESPPTNTMKQAILISRKQKTGDGNKLLATENVVEGNSPINRSTTTYLNTDSNVNMTLSSRGMDSMNSIINMSNISSMNTNRNHVSEVVGSIGMYINIPHDNSTDMLALESPESVHPRRGNEVGIDSYVGLRKDVVNRLHMDGAGSLVTDSGNIIDIDSSVGLHTDSAKMAGIDSSGGAQMERANVVGVVNSDGLQKDYFDMVGMNSAGIVQTYLGNRFDPDGSSGFRKDRVSIVDVNSSDGLGTDRANRLEVNASGDLRTDRVNIFGMDSSSGLRANRINRVGIDGSSSVRKDPVDIVSVGRSGNLPMDLVNRIHTDSTGSVLTARVNRVDMDSSTGLRTDSANMEGIDSTGGMKMDRASRVGVGNADGMQTDYLDIVGMDSAGSVHKYIGNIVGIDGSRELRQDHTNRVDVSNSGGLRTGHVNTAGTDRSGGLRQNRVNRVGMDGASNVRKDHVDIVNMDKSGSLRTDLVNGVRIDSADSVFMDPLKGVDSSTGFRTVGANIMGIDRSGGQRTDRAKRVGMIDSGDLRTDRVNMGMFSSGSILTNHGDRNGMGISGSVRTEGVDRVGRDSAGSARIDSVNIVGVYNSNGGLSNVSTTNNDISAKGLKRGIIITDIVKRIDKIVDNNQYNQGLNTYAGNGTAESNADNTSLSSAKTKVKKVNSIKQNSTWEHISSNETMYYDDSYYYGNDTYGLNNASSSYYDDRAYYYNETSTSYPDNLSTGSIADRQIATISTQLLQNGTNFATEVTGDIGNITHVHELAQSNANTISIDDAWINKLLMNETLGPLTYFNHSTTITISNQWTNQTGNQSSVATPTSTLTETGGDLSKNLYQDIVQVPNTVVVNRQATSKAPRGQSVIKTDTSSLAVSNTSVSLEYKGPVRGNNIFSTNSDSNKTMSFAKVNRQGTDMENMVTERFQTTKSFDKSAVWPFLDFETTHTQNFTAGWNQESTKYGGSGRTMEGKHLSIQSNVIKTKASDAFSTIDNTINTSLETIPHHTAGVLPSSGKSLSHFNSLFLPKRFSNESRTQVHGTSIKHMDMTDKRYNANQKSGRSALEFPDITANVGQSDLSNIIGSINMPRSQALIPDTSIVTKDLTRDIHRNISAIDLISSNMFNSRIGTDTTEPFVESVDTFTRSRVKSHTLDQSSQHRFDISRNMNKLFEAKSAVPTSSVNMFDNLRTSIDESTFQTTTPPSVYKSFKLSNAVFDISTRAYDRYVGLQSTTVDPLDRDGSAFARMSNYSRPTYSLFPASKQDTRFLSEVLLRDHRPVTDASLTSMSPRVSATVNVDAGHISTHESNIVGEKDVNLHNMNFLADSNTFVDQYGGVPVNTYPDNFNKVSASTIISEPLGESKTLQTDDKIKRNIFSHATHVAISNSFNDNYDVFPNRNLIKHSTSTFGFAVPVADNTVISSRQETTDTLQRITDIDTIPKTVTKVTAGSIVDIDVVTISNIYNDIIKKDFTAIKPVSTGANSTNNEQNEFSGTSTIIWQPPNVSSVSKITINVDVPLLPKHTVQSTNSPAVSLNDDTRGNIIAPIVSHRAAIRRNVSHLAPDIMPPIKVAITQLETREQQHREYNRRRVNNEPNMIIKQLETLDKQHRDYNRRRLSIEPPAYIKQIETREQHRRDYNRWRMNNETTVNIKQLEDREQQHRDYNRRRVNNEPTVNIKQLQTRKQQNGDNNRRVNTEPLVHIKQLETREQQNRDYSRGSVNNGPTIHMKQQPTRNVTLFRPYFTGSGRYNIMTTWNKWDKMGSSSNGKINKGANANINRSSEDFNVLTDNLSDSTLWDINRDSKNTIPSEYISLPSPVSENVMLDRYVQYGLSNGQSGKSSNTPQRSDISSVHMTPTVASITNGIQNIIENTTTSNVTDRVLRTLQAFALELKAREKTTDNEYRPVIANSNYRGQTTATDSKLRNYWMKQMKNQNSYPLFKVHRSLLTVPAKAPDVRHGDYAHENANSIRWSSGTNRLANYEHGSDNNSFWRDDQGNREGLRNSLTESRRRQHHQRNNNPHRGSGNNTLWMYRQRKTDGVRELGNNSLWRYNQGYTDDVRQSGNNSLWWYHQGNADGSRPAANYSLWMYNYGDTGEIQRSGKITKGSAQGQAVGSGNGRLMNIMGVSDQRGWNFSTELHADISQQNVSDASDNNSTSQTIINLSHMNANVSDLYNKLSQAFANVSKNNSMTLTLTEMTKRKAESLPARGNEAVHIATPVIDGASKIGTISQNIININEVDLLHPFEMQNVGKEHSKNKSSNVMFNNLFNKANIIMSRPAKPISDKFIVRGIGNLQHVRGVENTYPESSDRPNVILDKHLLSHGANADNAISIEGKYFIGQMRRNEIGQFEPVPIASKFIETTLVADTNEHPAHENNTLLRGTTNESSFSISSLNSEHKISESTRKNNRVRTETNADFNRLDVNNHKLVDSLDIQNSLGRVMLSEFTDRQRTNSANKGLAKNPRLSSLTAQNQTFDADSRNFYNQDNLLQRNGILVNQSVNTLRATPNMYPNIEQDNTFVKTKSQICKPGELYACIAIGNYRFIPGMVWWCFSHCKRNVCPPEKCSCRCKNVTSIESSTNYLRVVNPVKSKDHNISRGKTLRKVIHLAWNGSKKTLFPITVISGETLTKSTSDSTATSSGKYTPRTFRGLALPGLV